MDNEQSIVNQSIPKEDGQEPISNNLVQKYLRPTTEYSLKILRNYFEYYRSFVRNNPLLVTEIESALYWISYLLATTKYHNSRIVSELLSSCSSLLTLFNDSLLRRAYGLDAPHSNSCLHTLRITLQFIEYVQVFVELTITKLYGHYGKWLVISIIEMIKAIIRLLLLFYYQQGLTHAQCIMPLNRMKAFEQFKSKEKSLSSREQQQSPRSSVDEAIVMQDDDDDNEEVIEDVHGNQSLRSNDSNHFQLKSSGRIIRNIEQAPSKDERTWLSPYQQQQLQRLMEKNRLYSPTVTQLNQKRLIGELLHILRPIIHLATGRISGGIDDRWTPYLVSLGLDVVSLQLLRGSCMPIDQNPFGYIMANHQNVTNVDDMWNWSERLEIQRRYLMLLMYLLRSPFYDQWTKQRLLRLISLFSNYIPLFGRLCRPLIRLLPEWQQVYFYVWN